MSYLDWNDTLENHDSTFHSFCSKMYNKFVFVSSPLIPSNFVEYYGNLLR